MASSGNWLSNGISRIQNGVNPLTAFFTAAPQASTTNAMGSGTYAPYGGTLNPNGYNPTITDPAAHAAAVAASPSAGPYAGGGGGSGSYDPNTDPTLVAQAKGQVNPLIAQLHQLYGDFNNQVDQYAADKRGVLDSNYNTNVTNDTNAYNKTSDQTNGVMTARGLADSSYLGNAQQGNKNDYSASLTNDKNAYGDSLDQLGSVIAGDKAAVAAEPKFDLSQYNDVNSLLSLRDALDTHIGNLQTQKAGLLTSGQLQGQLNAIAPAKSNLDTTLKSRLDSLATSGAPADATYGLGQGYISNSGLSKADQDKWTSYLSNLLSSSKPTAA